MEITQGDAIYFVGIGGIAMSAVAGLAKSKGFKVFGSDKAEVYAPAKDILDENDIPYTIGYHPQNIIDHPSDIFVLSAGEDMTNPEVAYLVEHDIPYYSFSELLTHLYDRELRVVVAGTHGKSTTAGLLGHLLKNIDNSSFMVGAVLQNYQANYYAGDGHYAVFEGDEYKATFDDPTPKFQFYKPDILVLTNLEFDHPDIFPNFESMRQEFEYLVENLPPDGLLMYNADDQALAQLAFIAPVRSFGFSIDADSDYKIEDISYGEHGTEFTLVRKDNQNQYFRERYLTALHGRLNVYNVAAAIATLRVLGFQSEIIASFLAAYVGVKRRFEVVGEYNGATVIDDYAHHPTAIRETLEAARTRYPGRTIWAVFEPHTFSRTQATLEDLSGSFAAADRVLISEIYPARENASQASINSEQVVKAVQARHPATQLVHSKEEALGVLRKEVKTNDVVIVMAVGSFNRLAYDLVEGTK